MAGISGGNRGELSLGIFFQRSKQRYLKTARRLVDIALRSRNLRGQGLEEGASTRMLIHAGRLVAAGVGLEEASQASIVLPITDDLDMREALTAAIAACL